ncbi:MAG TPA: hypothetical protein VFM88_01105 [Vicinamibacteria bacterium]|nr:hypothetical protein [Vicinamibacteria bacterium]
MNPPHRAVVFVRADTLKVGQQYVDPLLVLSGSEYAKITFADLHERICDALRGDRPRHLMEVWGPKGVRVMFEDGSARAMTVDDLKDRRG